MVVVLLLRHLGRLEAPTSMTARLGATHPQLTLDLQAFPTALSPTGVLPGGLALQRSRSTLRVWHRPAGEGAWLVFGFEAARRAAVELALPEPPRRVADRWQPDRLEWTPAPTAAWIRDASGEGVFAAGVAEIPPSGLIVVARGSYGHGRSLWTVTPAGGAEEVDYGTWLAAHAPMEELAQRLQ